MELGSEGSGGCWVVTGGGAGDGGGAERVPVLRGRKQGVAIPAVPMALGHLLELLPDNI